jgi:hypothetical protein
MLRDKQFYIDLPKINGYKWAFYDKGFHCFTRKLQDEWQSSYVKEEDIKDGFYVNILMFGLSRK